MPACLIIPYNITMSLLRHVFQLLIFPKYVSSGNVRRPEPSFKILELTDFTHNQTIMPYSCFVREIMIIQRLRCIKSDYVKPNDYSLKKKKRLLPLT